MSDKWGKKPGAVHPLDAWIKGQLQQLHEEVLDEPLPDDIAELVSKLDERLNANPRRPDTEPRREENSTVVGGVRQQGEE